MPKLRYPRREPTQDWQQLRPLRKRPAQITYEIIRPVLIFGTNPKERAAETGLSARTIYYRANLFDQAGMASLLPPTLPPPVPTLDKRTLPPPMRQAMVDLKAEYPALKIQELATICFVQFGRRPSAQTIKLVLAADPKASRNTRRFPPYAEMSSLVQRRLVIIRLHTEGWTPTSIAGYLETSRKTFYQTLKRWAEEQFAGLVDKPHLPQQPTRKTSLQAINEARSLQENPELDAFRIQAASGGRPKKEMPFKVERRHQYWAVGIRYLDMQHAVEGQVYCISLYGEESLAGKYALVNFFQETLTREYQDHPRSRYSVEFQPDDRRFRRVGNPRLYEHPSPSAQLPLWEPGEVEWQVIIACQPYSLRRKRIARALVVQPPLLP